MRVEWDSDPAEPPICTDCGLKIYENKFEFGQMHAKKRHCFEEGVGIRKHLDTLVSMHRKAVMLLQGYREGRDRDREDLRKGASAWQKRIKEAEKGRDNYKAVADIHLKEIYKLRNSVAEAEAMLEKVGSLKMDVEIAELQHKLANVENERDNWKGVADVHLKEVCKLRNSVTDVEKQAARMKAALQMTPCICHFEGKLDSQRCVGKCARCSALE